MPTPARIALITGASGGIGSAIARRFAAEGFRLALCGRNTEKLEAVRAGLLGYQRLAFGKFTDILTHQEGAVFFEGVAHKAHHIGQSFAAINALPPFGVENLPIAVGIPERFMDGTVLRPPGIAVVAERFAAVIMTIEN